MSPRKNFDHLQYPLADALGVIGEWWTPLILAVIAGGAHRYEEMHASLGIARNILSDRLATLLEHQVIVRVQYSEKPARFEYHLTEKGHAALPIISLIEEWGSVWVAPSKGEPAASTER
jgi:DNA-binding HxlR family transcriptional regulator